MPHYAIICRNNLAAGFGNFPGLVNTNEKPLRVQDLIACAQSSWEHFDCIIFTHGGQQEPKYLQVELNS